jgi:hypothetical protein
MAVVAVVEKAEADDQYYFQWRSYQSKFVCLGDIPSCQIYDPYMI